jgi:hypothetical protein
MLPIPDRMQIIHDNQILSGGDCTTFRTMIDIKGLNLFNIFSRLEEIHPWRFPISSFAFVGKKTSDRIN